MMRRRFMLKAGGALVAAGSAALLDAPNVIAQPKFQWRIFAAFTARSEADHRGPA